MATVEKYPTAQGARWRGALPHPGRDLLVASSSRRETRDLLVASSSHTVPCAGRRPVGPANDGGRWSQTRQETGAETGPATPGGTGRRRTPNPPTFQVKPYIPPLFS
jgi:hypothetical protein